MALQAGEGDVDPGKTYYFTSSTMGQPKGEPKGGHQGGEKDEPPQGKGGKGDHSGSGAMATPKGDSGSEKPQGGKHDGKDGNAPSKRPAYYTWEGAELNGKDGTRGKGSDDGKPDSAGWSGGSDGGREGGDDNGKSDKVGPAGRGRMPTIRYVGTPRAHRGEIVTERGKTFRDCELIEADGHGLTFRHRDGMAKIGYGDMKREMQQEFGYDPEAAKQERRDRNERMRRSHSGRPHGNGGGSPGNQGYGTWGGNHPVGPFNQGGHPVIGTYYTARAGSTNPYFATNTLGQILDYRYNGYSNISLSEQLYHQHFAAHSGVVYRTGPLRPAVIAAPPYLPYVRNIYPRQIGTFAAGPSGGSLVPTLRSGYSQKGTVAPSLVPTPRR